MWNFEIDFRIYIRISSKINRDEFDGIDIDKNLGIIAIVLSIKVIFAPLLIFPKYQDSKVSICK